MNGMKKFDLLISIMRTIVRLTCALLYLYYGWTGKGDTRALLFLVLALLFVPDLRGGPKAHE